jgi:hypothetical protein
MPGPRIYVPQEQGGPDISPGTGLRIWSFINVSKRSHHWTLYLAHRTLTSFLCLSDVLQQETARWLQPLHHSAHHLEDTELEYTKCRSERLLKNLNDVSSSNIPSGRAPVIPFPLYTEEFSSAGWCLCNAVPTKHECILHLVLWLIAPARYCDECKSLVMIMIKITLFLITPWSQMGEWMYSCTILELSVRIE